MSGHPRLPGESVAVERNTVVIVTMAILVALGLGILSSINPVLALAGLAALVIAPAAVLRPKVIPYLLVFTIFAEAMTVGGVSVGRLAAPLAFIGLVSHLSRAPARLRGATLTLRLICGYLFLAAASLLWTVSVGATLNALASLGISLTYLAAFAVLIRTPRDVRRLLWAVAAASVALGWLWITQFASGVDRRFNTAGDPNFFAAFQIIAVPLILVLLTSEKSLGRRMVLYASIAIVADSIISTLSRGGLIVLAVIVVLITLTPSRFFFRSSREKLAFLTAALVGLALVAPFAAGALSHRFEVGLSSPNVAGGRSDLWAAALHGYRQHPLTGIGLGGFKATSFQLLRTTSGVNLISHARFAAREGEFVHNAYLGSLVELGPAGLALFVGILLATAGALRNSARRARAVGDRFLRSVSNALMVSLVAMALSSLLLSTETSRGLWFIVGLALAMPGLVPAVREEPLQTPSPTQAPRTRIRSWNWDTV
jgi:O-antigen ligase